MVPTMSESQKQSDFPALVGLIKSAASIQAVFPYIAANASQLRLDAENFTRYASENQTQFYEGLLVSALGECLSSGSGIQTFEQARDHATTLALLEGKAPWLISLLQSIWHLLNDSSQRPVVPQQLDDGAVVLVPIFNETRFCELTLRSIRLYAGIRCHVIAVNNSAADVSTFRNHIIESCLVDEWFDTGVVHHGVGLQKALSRIEDFRYIVSLDSDAVGLASGWLRHLIEKLTAADAALIGPPREPDRNTIIGQAVHPCCMVIDRKRIGSAFQPDFRSLWPFWDVGGLLTWDCKAHSLPIVSVKHEYSGNCATSSTLIDGAIRHYWYTSRIVSLDDDAVLDGYRVGDIRARLENEYNSHSLDEIKGIPVHTLTQRPRVPRLSVVLTTCNRQDLLGTILQGLSVQTAPRQDFEVVVVDDGSNPPVRDLVTSFADRLDIRYFYQNNAGLAAARNAGVKAAAGDIILFHDDDDLPDPELIAEHLRSHSENPDEAVVVLGHLDWHPSLKVTPLMHYITHEGGQYFRYGRMVHGQLYSAWLWWGGLVSAKTSLLRSIPGPFKESFRFGHEDTELVCRSAARGIKVLYNANAKKFILRPVSLDDFCRRRLRQGRALYHLNVLHSETIMARYQLKYAEDEYEQIYQSNLPNWHKLLQRYEPILSANPEPFIAATDSRLEHLRELWGGCFRGYQLKGYLEEAKAAGTGSSTMTLPANLDSPIAAESGATPAQPANAPTQYPEPLATGKTAVGRILMICPSLPHPDAASSGNRVHNILKMLVEQGHTVEIIYFKGLEADPAYVESWGDRLTFTHLQEDISIVVGHLNLSRVLPDCVWMTRLWTPETCEFMHTIACWMKRHIPQVRLVIDTMDYHSKKYMRKFAHSHDEMDRLLAERFKAVERHFYPLADRVVTVTENESNDIAADIPQCSCAVVPNIHDKAAVTGNFESRQHICFIGSLDLNHNADAVLWFINEIFATIRREQPDVEFHIIGFDNEKYKSQLETARGVKVIGYVPDAVAAVSQYRLSVCPLLYGAGMKGKLGTAASAGTPFVTTTIGAEGFAFADGAECFIADSAHQFAGRCLTLINDKACWTRLAANMGRKFASSYSPEAVAPKVAHLLSDLAMARPRSLPRYAPSGKPRVSIVTPCFNAERFLPEAIKSIQSQTLVDWELLLMDDCSTDGTRDIIAGYAARDPRIRAFYFDDNKGPYVRRNFAVQHAASDFIVVHDADDIMLPLKLERLYEVITSDDNIGIVGHRYQCFVDEFRGFQFTEWLVYPLDEQKMWEATDNNRDILLLSAAIIRRKLFDIVGPYCENPFGSDSLFQRKVAIHWQHTGKMRVVNIPDGLMLRRMHGASQTGILPHFDRRNKRQLFANVINGLTAELRKKLASAGSEEVSELFKACTCDDFASRYAHEIAARQAEPLSREILLGWANKAVELFNRGCYVSCLRQLLGLENILPEASARLKNLNLLKAMAFHQLGFYERCAPLLEAEEVMHHSKAARQFLQDFIRNRNCTDVLAWCAKFDPIYDLSLKDIQTPDLVTQSSEASSVQAIAQQLPEMVTTLLDKGRLAPDYETSGK
jgi:glycosyltransferase involved in cell wall biosynthesis